MRDFDFQQFLAAAGWSNKEAATRIGLTPDTVGRISAGKHPLSEKTIAQCKEAARIQIEALSAFLDGVETPASPVRLRFRRVASGQSPVDGR